MSSAFSLVTKSRLLPNGKTAMLFSSRMMRQATTIAGATSGASSYFIANPNPSSSSSSYNSTVERVPKESNHMLSSSFPPLDHRRCFFSTMNSSTTTTSTASDESGVPSSSSSSPPRLDLDEKEKEYFLSSTKKLLDPNQNKESIQLFLQQDMDFAIQLRDILQWWIRQTSLEAVPVEPMKAIFQILDLLAQVRIDHYNKYNNSLEEDPSTAATTTTIDFVPILDMKSIHGIVFCYRQSIKSFGQSTRVSIHSLPTPEFVVSKLDYYQSCKLVPTDTKMYNVVLDASIYYYSRDPSTAVRFGEELVQYLFQKSSLVPTSTTTTTTKEDQEQTKEPTCYVNHATLTTLAMTWINSRLREGPRKAEEWLDRCLDMCNSHNSQQQQVKDSTTGATMPLSRLLRPQRKFYTTVIYGWGQVGNINRVEATFQKQLEEYFVHGFQRAKPDTHNFNCVIDALVKSKDPDTPTRVEDILRQMIQMSKTNTNNASTSTSSSAISSATSAEDLDDEEDGDHDKSCNPDMRTWNAAISCWARHADAIPGAAENAEHLLLELIDRLVSSGEQIESPLTSLPTAMTVSLNAVLHGYVKAKNARRAQALFDQMFASSSSSSSHHEQQQDTPSLLQTMQPNVITFNTLISAWLKSNETDAAQRAEKLLGQMKHWSIEPQILTYGNVMSCWAKAAQIGLEKDNDDETIDAAQHAEDLFLSMKVAPTTISYNIVLTAWARVAHLSSAETAKYGLTRSEAFLRDVVLPLQKQEGDDALDTTTGYTAATGKCTRDTGRVSSKAERPDSTTFRLVLRAIDTSQVRDKRERALKILGLMQDHNLKPGVREWNILKRLGIR